MRAGSEHHVFDAEVAGLLHAPRLHALATHTILVFDGRLEHRNAQTLTRKRTSEGSTTDSTPDHDDIRYVAHPCPFRRCAAPIVAEAERSRYTGRPPSMAAAVLCDLTLTGVTDHTHRDARPRKRFR